MVASLLALVGAAWREEVSSWRGNGFELRCGRRGASVPGDVLPPVVILMGPSEGSPLGASSRLGPSSSTRSSTAGRSAAGSVRRAQSAGTQAAFAIAGSRSVGSAGSSTPSGPLARYEHRLSDPWDRHRRLASCMVREECRPRITRSCRGSLPGRRMCGCRSRRRNHELHQSTPPLLAS